MPPRVHRLDFVPPTVGMAHVSVDVQGRIVVPKDLRPAFETRLPPIEVVWTLARRGCAIVHPADSWPDPEEREIIASLRQLVDSTSPAALERRQLPEVQDFCRLIACRYLDGSLLAKWQLQLPAPVLAWLGLPPMRRLRSRRTARTKKESRSRPSSVTPRADSSLIVIGVFGALEFWTTDRLGETLPEQTKEFSRLATDAVQILRHAQK